MLTAGFVGLGIALLAVHLRFLSSDQCLRRVAFVLLDSSQPALLCLDRMHLFAPFVRVAMHKMEHYARLESNPAGRK